LSTSATSPGSPDRDDFASWTGTAPIDASGGQNIRRRLSRAGIVQLRYDTKAAAATGAASLTARPAWT